MLPLLVAPLSKETINRLQSFRIHAIMDSTTLSFWRQGVSLWYSEDYFMAMTVWQHALQDLVDPIDFPWRQQEQRRRGDDNDDNDGVLSANYAGLSRLIPLYLFLGGCYLDAQEFAMAEKCCRQGLQLLLVELAHDDGNNVDNVQDNNMPKQCQRKNLGIRLVQELMSCWEENPDTSLRHCQESRKLVQWILRQEQKHHHHRHSTAIIGNYWKDAWQRPAFVYPDLPSQAHCPSQDQPGWCRILEDCYDTIRGECQALLATNDNGWRGLPRVGDGSHRQGAGAHDGNVVSAGGDWREVVLFGAGAEPAGSVAPQTRALLQAHCPDAVSLADQGGGEVIFSILAPRTRIARHCASTNLRWTAHLGLIVPSSGTTKQSGPRVQIRVADTWHGWEEGKMLVFDDSYEHEVVNESPDEIRVVLLMRFWNPNLPVAARSDALQQALDWKAKEQEGRFHPPGPPLDC